MHAVICILLLQYLLDWRQHKHAFFMRGLVLRIFLLQRRKDNMAERLYFEVFNRITEMIEELKDLQAKMEEMYLNGKEC